MAFTNRKKPAFFAVFLLLTGLAVADGLDYYGAGVHLMFGRGNPDEVFSLLRQTGFNSVRDEFNWSVVEAKPGEYRMPKSYLEFLEKARAERLTPLIMLGYGHHAYDAGDYPRSGNAQAAYARFARTVTEAMPPGAPKLLQLWNEWDGGTGMRKELAGTGDVPAYLNLLDATVPGLHGLGVTVIGNSYTKSQNYDAAVKAGLLNRVDIPSIHTYNYFHGPGANAESWEQFLDSAILPVTTRAGKGGSPLFITEMGYPTSLGSKGRDAADAAAQHVRLWLLAQGIPNLRGLWVYDFINDGWDAGNDEDNFGLTEADLTPKEAQYAIRGMLNVLRDAHPTAEVPTGVNEIHLLPFRHADGRTTLALWSSNFNDDWQVTLTRPDAVGVELLRPGRRPVRTRWDRKLTVTANAMPWLLTGADMRFDRVEVRRIPRPNIDPRAPEKLQLAPRVLTAEPFGGGAPVFRNFPLQNIWRGDKGWHGEADFQAEYAVRWSPDALFWDFLVRDDRFQRGETADRITLFLRHAGTGSDPGGRVELEFRYGPSPISRVMYCGETLNVRPVANGTLRDGRWHCSIRIPAKMLGVPKLQDGDLLEVKPKILDYDNNRTDQYTIASFGLGTTEFLLLNPRENHENTTVAAGSGR